MKAMIDERDNSPQVSQQRTPTDVEREQAFAALGEAVRTALETYANVHRGSGHHSTVTTALYEQAREIVLAALRRTSDTYTVIFCTPRRAAGLERQLDPRHFTTLSSQDLGLPLGLRALVVARKALPVAPQLRPGAGPPGWSPQVGSSGLGRPTALRRARLRSSTRSRSPGPWS